MIQKLLLGLVEDKPNFLRSWRYLADVGSAMLAGVLKTESCGPSQHLCGCGPLKYWSKFCWLNQQWMRWVMYDTVVLRATREADRRLCLPMESFTVSEKKIHKYWLSLWPPQVQNHASHQPMVRAFGFKIWARFLRSGCLCDVSDWTPFCLPG